MHGEKGGGAGALYVMCNIGVKNTRGVGGGRKARKAFHLRGDAHKGVVGGGGRGGGGVFVLFFPLIRKKIYFV